MKKIEITGANLINIAQLPRVDGVESNIRQRNGDADQGACEDDPRPRIDLNKLFGIKD